MPTNLKNDVFIFILFVSSLCESNELIFIKSSKSRFQQRKDNYIWIVSRISIQMQNSKDKCNYSLIHLIEIRTIFDMQEN